MKTLEVRNSILFRLFCLLLLFTGFPLISHGQTFKGTVVKVPDGDTLHVRLGGAIMKVRLNGIDCPELGQRFGDEAKEFTTRLVMNKEVMVKGKGEDSSGYIVADVILEDQINVGHEILKAGYAWWFSGNPKEDGTLFELEREAKNEKLGLWSDPNPVAPWVYRRGK